MTRAGLAASVALALACVAGCRAPLPAAMASVVEPTDASGLLPADLDVVVRLDVTKLRAHALDEIALAAIAAAVAEESRALVQDVLRGAALVFVGGRPLGDGWHGDGALAAEPVAAIARPARAVEAGPGELERPSAPRDGVALLARVGERVVLATPAEVDATRARATSRGDAALAPATQGLGSFAVRGRGVGPLLVAAGRPQLARVVEGLVSAHGALDDGQGGALALTARLTFATRERAAAARADLEGAFAALAATAPPLRAAQVAAEGPVLTVRVPFAP